MNATNLHYYCMATDTLILYDCDNNSEYNGGDYEFILCIICGSIDQMINDKCEYFEHHFNCPLYGLLKNGLLMISKNHKFHCSKHINIILDEIDTPTA